jgi:DNA-binding NarL/FixJ family response regulator
MNALISIVIVEDRADYRSALVSALASESRFNLAGVYESAEQAMMGIVDAFANDELEMPLVVLMDIGLPEMSGIECVHALKATFPDVLFMMLTTFNHDEAIFEALAAGAHGYLLKDSSHEEIIRSIIELSSGGAPMSAQIARRIVQTFHSTSEPPLADHNRTRGMHTPPNTAQKFASTLTTILSVRECEVLSHLSKGYSYQEIADALFISLSTVRTHLYRIYTKLHVSNRHEALLKAKML